MPGSGTAMNRGERRTRFPAYPFYDKLKSLSYILCNNSSLPYISVGNPPAGLKITPTHIVGCFTIGISATCGGCGRHSRHIWGCWHPTDYITTHWESKENKTRKDGNTIGNMGKGTEEMCAQARKSFRPRYKGQPSINARTGDISVLVKSLRSRSVYFIRVCFN